MKRSLLTLLLTLVAVVAFAVPARRDRMERVQPDGTTVGLRLVGDEFYHFFLTDDNMMVLADGPGYYFATLDNDGYPAPSKVLAADPAKRGAAQSAFVAQMSRTALLGGAQKAGKANRAMREVTTASLPFRAPAAAASATNDWESKGRGLFPNSNFPVTGSPKMCAILVQFKDARFTMSDPATYFTNFAKQRGFSNPGHNLPNGLTLTDSNGNRMDFNPLGSAVDYFAASSNGKFTPDFDIYGPVTLPNNMAYYGGNSGARGSDMRPHLMIRDAVQLLDDSVDFSQYDLDGDGEIDMVYVIYAGWGEAAGGPADNIWPHAWYVYKGGNVEEYFDGKLLDHYACSSEIYYQFTYNNNSYYIADGIGTFCHEFSHVLGLPDEYDVDYGDAYEQDLTPGNYSVMDQGSYNQSGRAPATHNIFQRNALGWADIEVLKPKTGYTIEMDHLINSNLGYAIETRNHGGNTNEFILLENRQLSSWDKALPGHGLLAWHITYDGTTWQKNKPNCDPALQRINLVSANGIPSDVAGRPFPGTSNVRAFTPTSNAGVNLETPITSITENTSTHKVSFFVNGGVVAKPTASVGGVNVTEAAITHEGPLTLTLTPGEAGQTIKYLTMTETDLSDEMTYTGELTISENSTIEFWAVRNADGIISETTELNITITPASGQDPEPGTESGTATFNLYKIWDNAAACADSWTSSYADHTVNFTEGTVTFDNANHQTSTITDYPVTKGNDVTVVMNNGYTPITAAKIQCQQWGSNAHTITIYSSTDGQNFTQVPGVSSNNFTLNCTSLPEGTKAVKFSFSGTKQIAIKQIDITYGSSAGGDEPQPVETVATPTFSPEGGKVEAGSKVTIACATEGAAIHYTTDGNVPTAASTLYTAPIAITEAVTIKAIAVKEGMNDSEVASAAYTVAATTPDPSTDGDTFTITYKGNGNSNDSNSAFGSNTAYQGAVETGGDIATWASCSYVYQGKEDLGIKFSSSKQNGTLTLNIAADYQKKISKVVINAMPYGSDDAKLAVNGSTAQSLSGSFSDYTYDLDGSVLTQLTLSATKRIYVKGITFYVAQESDPSLETVATPTFSPEGGEVEAGSTVTIACATEGAAIHYTTDGNAPTAESALYSAPIAITEAVTIKAIAVKDGMNDSEVATATYTVPLVAPDGCEGDGSAANPYNVAMAKWVIANNLIPADEVYVTGVISDITEVSTSYGNATYNIIDEGKTDAKLLIYRGKYLNNEAFTAEDQIQVDDAVVVYGKLKLYNSTDEMDQGNYLVSIERQTPPVDDRPTREGSFRIVYNDNSSDASRAIAASDYTAYCLEGGDIATPSTISNVYKGTTGLKFSSGSNAGSLTLTIAADYQKKISKVVVSAKKYGSDASKLAVNGSTAQDISADLADYTFELDGSTLSSLKLDATKRLYVKSITFYYDEPYDPSYLDDVNHMSDGDTYTMGTALIVTYVFNSYAYVYDEANETYGIINCEGHKLIPGDIIQTGWDGTVVVVNGQHTLIPDNVGDIVATGETGTIPNKFGISKDNFNDIDLGDHIARHVRLHHLLLTSSLTDDADQTLECELIDYAQYPAKAPAKVEEESTPAKVTIRNKFAAEPITIADGTQRVFEYVDGIVHINGSDLEIYPTEFSTVWTGIDTVTADDIEGAEYYNLQGIRVTKPAAGQILIRRVGAKATKVLVK